jgi:hypothetical protein
MRGKKRGNRKILGIKGDTIMLFKKYVNKSMTYGEIL